MPKTTNPERWAEIRVALGTDKFRLLWIKPEENVLIGWWRICNYLGIKDRKTLLIWVDDWALPAIKRPDGIWMTTMTSIDQWIMMAAQSTWENKSRDGDLSSQKKAIRTRAQQEAKMERRAAQSAAEPVRPEAIPGPVGGVAGMQPGPTGDTEVR